MSLIINEKKLISEFMNTKSKKIKMKDHIASAPETLISSLMEYKILGMPVKYMMIAAFTGLIVYYGSKSFQALRK